MSVSPELRNQIMAQAQGAMALYAAFIGVANPLFATLAKSGKVTPGELARQTGLDPGYVSRWCDAAFAFGYLEETDSQLKITDLGSAFLPEFKQVGMETGVHLFANGNEAVVVGRKD